MTDEEAMDAIHDGLVGPESLPVKLREKKGLDRALLARVEEAMKLLAERWRGRRDVPKRVASAFVDLGGSMAWAEGAYPEEEEEEIEEASMRLVELAYDLLNDDEQDAR